ncbi:MAG: site-2 protease family protein [Actinomycetota bacterium]|nr:site-2 protease family protein [Actinomycetota bacterium]
MPSSSAAFRLFGFPVRVGAGFWMFMVLIALTNSSSLGTSGAFTLAALIAAFTLLHELGHAVAARATGAKAEITLAFMAGYASFIPTRTLSRWERVGISFAGPGIQIAVGTIVYALLGGPLTWPIEGLTPTQFAALWAGPVIGVFNLIPILPFDGGNILEQAVDRVSPTHSRRIMIVFTVVVAVGTMLYMATQPNLRGLIIFMAIPLLSVGQIISAGRAHDNRAKGQEALARAEALAWATGDVSRFPPGHVPSPWFRAHQQLQHGHPEVARQLLVAELTDPTIANNWWPPDAAPLRDLEALVDLLPRPLPHGRPFNDFVLSGILLRLGEYQHAATFAAEGYNNGRPAMLAVHVARSAAALGDRDTAVAWLRAASTTAPPHALQIAIDAAPEFEVLRSDPRVAQLLPG